MTGISTLLHFFIHPPLICIFLMYVSYLIYNSDVTCSEHCLKVFETGVYPGPCKASQNGKGCYIK